MAELLAMLYYALMLAGSVSLGKIVFLAAGTGGVWAEDERSTGLASITGLAIVVLALALELFLLKGSAFPAAFAFAGFAAAGSRALLLKKPLSLPALKLEQMMAAMEESPQAGQKRENASAANQTEQARDGSWSAGNEKTGVRDEPSPSQKIGEVIRLQGGKSGREKSGEKRKKPSGEGFEEIKWAE